MIVASTLIALSDGLMIARDIPATRELHGHFCSRSEKVSLRSSKELNTHVAQLLSSSSIFSTGNICLASERGTPGTECDTDW